MFFGDTVYLDADAVLSFYRSIVDSLNSLELIASPSSCLVAFWQLKINEYEWLAFSVLVLKDKKNLTTQETQFIEILHTVPKWVLDNVV